MEGKYKIWCETNKERDEVLKEMDKRGWKWATKHDALKWDYVPDAPIGLFYGYGMITCTESKGEYLRLDEFKELCVQEFLGKPKCTKQIHITTDGTNTYAILKENGKVVKRTQAKCSPEDEFDFEKGSRIALNRLFTDFNQKGYINVSSNEKESKICSYNVTENTLVNVALALLEHTKLDKDFIRGIRSLISSQYK